MRALNMDIKMAWRNLGRNSRRTFLSASAVAFACLLLVFMLSLQLGTYAGMIENTLMLATGHLQIQAKGFHQDKEMRRVVTDASALQNILDSISPIRCHTARSNAFALISSDKRSSGAMIVGVDPDREARVSRLEEIIQKGSYFQDQGESCCLMGNLLAQKLQMSLGDELVLLGQGRDGSIAATTCILTGIYSSGQKDFDSSMVHIPLQTFSETFSMRGAVHKMVCMANSLDDVAWAKQSIKRRIKDLQQRKDLVVLDWKELVPGLVQSIKLDLYGGMIQYLILIIVVAFSILNTFLMAVFERNREFGVLLALGTTPGRLCRVLLLESGFICLLGLIAGILLGAAITLFFAHHGLGLPGVAEDVFASFGIPDRIYPRLSYVSALAGPGLVLLITLLTAMYPAFKVYWISPVRALHDI